MSEHIVKQFDTDLESIRSRVLQYGWSGRTADRQGDECLGNETSLIEQTIKHDDRVNRFEVELDEHAQHIARRQRRRRPGMVMMVVKTITDSNASAMKQKKSPKKARSIHSADTHLKPSIELRHVAGLAIDMLRKALDAFSRLDLNARPGRASGKEVDAEFRPSCAS